jgi:hypothetical protein
MAQILTFCNSICPTSVQSCSPCNVLYIEFNYIQSEGHLSRICHYSPQKKPKCRMFRLCSPCGCKTICPEARRVILEIRRILLTASLFHRMLFHVKRNWSVKINRRYRIKRKPADSVNNARYSILKVWSSENSYDFAAPPLFTRSDEHIFCSRRMPFKRSALDLPRTVWLPRQIRVQEDKKGGSFTCVTAGSMRY